MEETCIFPMLQTTLLIAVYNSCNGEVALQEPHGHVLISGVVFELSIKYGRGNIYGVHASHTKRNLEIYLSARPVSNSFARLQTSRKGTFRCSPRRRVTSEAVRHGD